MMRTDKQWPDMTLGERVSYALGMITLAIGEGKVRGALAEIIVAEATAAYDRGQKKAEEKNTTARETAFKEAARIVREACSMWDEEPGADTAREVTDYLAEVLLLEAGRLSPEKEAPLSDEK